MTAAAKTTIKSWIPFLSFLPAFWMVFAWGQYTEQNESRMFKDAAQKEVVVSHSTKGTDSYKNVHMELMEKDSRYVNTGEFEAIKDDIKETKNAILTIQDDVKEILKANK